MKRFLLLLFVLPFLAMGQTAEPPIREELKLIEKIYYDRDVYIALDEERAKLNDLIAEMRADSTLKIHIVGYGDKWGGDSINDRFSHVRAMYIAEWMRSCRVPATQIIFVGEGVDRDADNDAEARRVDVSQIVESVVEIAPQPQPVPSEPESVPVEPEPVPSEIQQVPAQPQPVPVETPQAPEPQPKSKSVLTLRTNLLYWLTGMINLGAELRFGDSPFGVLLNGGYSPFGGADWSHALGGWYLSPELRYYIPCNDRWFVGAQLLAQGFNYKLGDTGYQGTFIGGGVMGGYKLTLTDRFDMDFTLGVGYGRCSYDRYYHSNGVNVIERSDLSKSALLPIHGGVNLIWKIK